MKIIAFYLPQFHRIPENDEWWGKGFTEWVNVKKASPLYQGHYQPRVPLNQNYYNLLDLKVQEWQCQLARKHGIYGFCFYHYWYLGKRLLHLPVENYLKNPACDMPFCISWANHDWTRAWVSKENEVLLKQEYGDEADWEEHFRYLLPFLKDERYIRIDRKPIIIIYQPEAIERSAEMYAHWEMMARRNGLNGICFISQGSEYKMLSEEKKKLYQWHIEYQPASLMENRKDAMGVLKRVSRRIDATLYRITGLHFHPRRAFINKNRLDKYDYEKMWEILLSQHPDDKKAIPGSFVDFDNSPRRSEKGMMMDGASPERFRRFFSRQVEKVKKEYHTDMLFMFAWNEWAEGGYLEPDERFEYGYLEAIRDTLREHEVFPESPVVEEGM